LNQTRRQRETRRGDKETGRRARREGDKERRGWGEKERI
jgi:hypothetical protein